MSAMADRTSRGLGGHRGLQLCVVVQHQVPAHAPRRGQKFAAPLRATRQEFHRLRQREVQASRATSSGTAPPTRNNTDQPKVGTIHAEMNPGALLPKVMPVNMRTTSVARSRFGDSSEFRAMVLGISPPMPMPVQKRSAMVTQQAVLPDHGQRGHAVDDTADQDRRSAAVAVAYVAEQRASPPERRSGWP